MFIALIFVGSVFAGISFYFRIKVQNYVIDRQKTIMTILEFDFFKLARRTKAMWLLYLDFAFLLLALFTYCLVGGLFGTTWFF